MRSRAAATMTTRPQRPILRGALLCLGLIAGAAQAQTSVRPQPMPRAPWQAPLSPLHRPPSPMESFQERQRIAGEERNRAQGDLLRRGMDANRQADAADRRSTDLRRALIDNEFVSERIRLDYEARRRAAELSRQKMAQDSDERLRERERLDLEREQTRRERLREANER